MAEGAPHSSPVCLRPPSHILPTSCILPQDAFLPRHVLLQFPSAWPPPLTPHFPLHLHSSSHSASLLSFLSLRARRSGPSPAWGVCAEEGVAAPEEVVGNQEQHCHQERCRREDSGPDNHTVVALWTFPAKSLMNLLTAHMEERKSKAVCSSGCN